MMLHRFGHTNNGEKVMQSNRERAVDQRSMMLRPAALPQHDVDGQSTDIDTCTGQKAALDRVAELEHVQKELISARQAAEESSRTKSRFLAIMSHEIRTPLNGVLGALQLLADPNPDPAQRELVDLARSSAESLRRVTNDVIELSRLEAGRLDLELAPLDIVALLNDICEFWRPLAVGKELSLQLSVDKQIPRQVMGDAVRIRQIVNNYVSNAINFTANGSILVKLASDHGNCHADDENVGVYLEVRDTGIGISRENQKRLFQDYSQVPYGEDDSGQRGAGLGLVICRELANCMGGSVGVSSKPGLGSTFWVRLSLQSATNPVSRGKASQTPVDLGPLRAADGTAPRVLLVEDSATNQIIAQTFLDQFGCQVDIACDGLEAVRAVKENEYDVVLMDVAMPRMDGVEATRLIRSLPGHMAQTRIVGQTAYALEEETRNFLASGMDDVVHKPLKRESLHSVLSHVLASETTAKIAESARPVLPTCIDTAVFGELKESVPAEQFVELLEQIMNDIDANGKEAITGARTGEISRLARACHTLKGLGASFGNPELESLASGIQIACRNGDATRATAMALTRLESVCANSVAGLKAYRQTTRATD
jgi:signal transduction histidine kinase/DNA-binding NarL/FixJ family response regulator